MADDVNLISDSWRIDQEILRRNAAPADPARINVDDLIVFLDQALRLADTVTAPRRPAADHARSLI
jgi:hypothetical protein